MISFDDYVKEIISKLPKHIGIKDISGFTTQEIYTFKEMYNLKCEIENIKQEINIPTKSLQKIKEPTKSNKDPYCDFGLHCKYQYLSKDRYKCLSSKNCSFKEMLK
jgi:hypothetical protein